jgi:2-desacetyl-2-hydroxyethyl bacteriochlorophyllide A dehydrogenase
MKAALLVGPQKIEIRDLPVPVPREGEVLVRVREAGICGTDFAKYRGDLGGNFPVVAGHEAVGEIAALGPGVAGIRIGERVAIQPNFACGQCETCRSGRENICPNRVRLGLDVDGVFAEYVTAPRKYVWTLPEGLSNSAAALTEPLSVALHGFQKSASAAGDRVLVYGTGTIGLFYVQLAVLSGARVTAFNTSGPRLEVARKLGAIQTFRSGAELEAEKGDFTIVYETSGAADALAHILQWSAPGARILLTGLPEKDSSIPAALIARKELLIQGAMTYQDEFRTALDLLQKGKIRSDLFITNIYPLDKLPEALADFRSPHRIKDLVRIP